MSAGRKRLLVILLAVAVLLWIVGAAVSPVVDGLDPRVKADNVILNAIPFLLTFVGIIVAFIAFIIFVATRLNNNISERVYRPIERLLIVGILVGVVGMFQPFTVVLYTIGFILLLVSTLGYIFWSHIVPHVPPERARQRDDGLGSVSVSEFEKRDVRGQM
jgi:hypothetical protein